MLQHSRKFRQRSRKENVKHDPRKHFDDDDEDEGFKSVRFVRFGGGKWKSHDYKKKNFNEDFHYHKKLHHREKRRGDGYHRKLVSSLQAQAMAKIARMANRDDE